MTPGSRRGRLLLGRQQAGDERCLRIATDRQGQGRALFTADAFAAPNAWAPDGRRLVYYVTSAQGGNSLWIRSLAGEPSPRRLGQKHASEWGADLSPDGRWIAYISDASRRWDVYLRAPRRRRILTRPAGWRRPR